MRRGLSPTQRTIRALRNQGTICDIAEKFNAFVGPHGVRQDLFGFIDAVALAPDCIKAIQCCAGSGHAEHKRKILANENAPEWLKSGGKIEIWSWSKRKARRGGKLELWMPRIEEITHEMFFEEEG